MRQPEVARLAALVLGLLLALPVLDTARTAVVAALFLAEFLTAGAAPLLSAVTPGPRRETLQVSDAVGDRYAAPALRAATPLVLLHGVTPAGKDDPRLAEAAALLARAGFSVLVPTVPGLTRGRLRPEDVMAVVATLTAATRARPAAVVGISVGAGPALIAAADPGVRDRVAIVVTLGGYASATELLRFFLTGDYAFGAVGGHVDHDPATVRAFLEANADLVDAASRARLVGGGRAAALQFLADLPPQIRSLLEGLSPERIAADIRAPVVLVHGRGDLAVPYTESLRLLAARPARTSLVVVGAVGHVEGGPRRQDLLELGRVWTALFRLFARA